jgi:hypothetical protein
MRRTLSVLVPLALALIFFQPLPAGAIHSAERSFFILDTSGSVNADMNWTRSLRPSIIAKLQQPFGQPHESNSPKNPQDIFVTSITSNSVDAQIFPVVTSKDAEIIWGMVDRVGVNPSRARLAEMIKDLFGGGGVWSQHSGFLAKSPLVIPSLSTCQSAVVRSLGNTQYFGRSSPEEKKDVAKTLCGRVIEIGIRLEAIDQSLGTSTCNNSGKCSDIIGALTNAVAAVQDMVSSQPRGTNPAVCVAIASDMLNNSPGMSTDSLLNSRRIAMKATSTQDALGKGIQAAEMTGIKFPKRASVRVVILGMGTGPNPLPREKNSMLKSYWDGFWQASGIKKTQLGTSLDRACTK